MEYFKKVWGWVVLGGSILVGLFFVERSARKKVEALLDNSESKAKDQILEYKQSEEQDKIVAEQKKIEELKKKHEEATKDLTPTEVESYWKNHK